MVTRVSTAFSQQSALLQMQKSNSSLSLLTHQVSSGLKARRFEELSSDTAQLLNLKDVTKNASVYIQNISTAQSRLTAQEGALNSLSELIVEAANLWTLGRNENSAEVRASMAPKAEGLAESFYEIFKTKFDGKYIFSGQASEQEPITASPAPSLFPGDPPPTAYYTGDPARPIVITGPGNTQTYGVTGDDLGFARLKAGLETLWFGLQNNSVPDIDGAIDLLEQAQRDVSDLLGEVGGQINGLNLVSQRHESNVIFLQDRVDELEKVDITEALTKFSQEESTLEASMLVLSRLSSISLLNYI
jgi:flagellar hook-associated protein 3 FlgL